jgi:hypothetical protein
MDRLFPTDDPTVVSFDWRTKAATSEPYPIEDQTTLLGQGIVVKVLCPCTELPACKIELSWLRLELVRMRGVEIQGS